MLFPFASNWIAAMAEKNAKCSNKVMDSRDNEDEILIYIFLVVALGAEVLLCIMLSGLLLNDKTVVFLVWTFPANHQAKDTGMYRSLSL